MKKSLLCLLLAFAMLFSLTACSKPADEGGETPADQPTEDTYELVVITDAKSVDDHGFNQYTWEGLKQYAEEKGISHTYYMPTEQAKEAYLTQIETAVKHGAKLICCPGYLFQAAVYEAQEMYPDVKFICIDFEPTTEDYSDTKTASNTVSVYFEEEESGFLAGYAAVKDGFRKLGFFGAMAVPSVKNFGYGYVAGAEYAAKELGLAKGDVSIKYSYTGDFNITPDWTTKAKSWYTAGTEIIFGCGAPENVFTACEDYNTTAQTPAWSIGVDTDMATMSDTVLTSSMKNLAPVVYAICTAYGEGKFPGGEVQYYTVNENALALPMETSRFRTFSAADYDAIFAKLVANENNLRTGLPVAADFAGDNTTPAQEANAMAAKVCEIVTVEVIE